MVACGAWSNRIAALFGEAVPMDARGPQMGVTEPLPYAIGPSIGVSSPIEFEGLYFRQIRRGNIVFGGGLKGPAHADAVRAYVKPDNVLRQLHELRRLVPAFAQVQLIRVWSGIEGYTADWQPVIGPSARTPGLHYAFGFNGEGFAISVGVGEVMAELIAPGRRRRRSSRSRSPVSPTPRRSRSPPEDAAASGRRGPAGGPIRAQLARDDFAKPADAVRQRFVVEVVVRVMQRPLAVRAGIGPPLPQPQVGAPALAQQEGEVFRRERGPRRDAGIEADRPRRGNVYEAEGPFAERAGYTGAQRPNPVIDVRAITCRRMPSGTT